MWWTGSFLFGPAGSQQPSVPTYWQALDLESTVVIVIYASSDDRCAHIVLSIWLRQLKVIARLGFNHCLFPRKWNCHHVSQLIQSDHKGLLLHSVTDKIQSFTIIQASERLCCAREISGKNAIINLRPFLSQGAMYHTSLDGIFWAHLLKDVPDVLGGKHGRAGIRWYFTPSAWQVL